MSGTLGSLLALAASAPSHAELASAPLSPHEQMLAQLQHKAASATGGTAPAAVVGQRKAAPRRRDDGDDDYAPVAGLSVGRARAPAQPPGERRAF